MQTHKPGPFAGSPDLTKMFHVKHFCPIGAKNLTWPRTAAPSYFCNIDRFRGAICGRRRRLEAESIVGKRLSVSFAMEKDCRTPELPPLGFARHLPLILQRP